MMLFKDYKIHSGAGDFLRGWIHGLVTGFVLAVIILHWMRS